MPPHLCNRAASARLRPSLPTAVRIWAVEMSLPVVRARALGFKDWGIRSLLVSYGALAPLFRLDFYGSYSSADAGPQDQQTLPTSNGRRQLAHVAWGALPNPSVSAGPGAREEAVHPEEGP